VIPEGVVMVSTLLERFVNNRAARLSDAEFASLVTGHRGARKATRTTRP
jgi:hypothetical protein